jgi:release factor glutamine methyltransferase
MSTIRVAGGISVTAQTIREAIAWGASLLHQGLSKQSQTFVGAPAEEQACLVQHEAMILLEHATGWSRTRILISLDHSLPDTAQASFRALVQRRAGGEPLQYVTGEAWFYGRPFAVRPGCLIPRPETEMLVECTVGWIRKHAPAARVVDLGTGSGCIAVTLALECPGTSVWALDISADALEIARRNATQHGAGVTFVQGDGIDWLGRSAADGGTQLNVLVSNPPYIPSHDVNELDSEVRAWEPRLALDGGDDGLDIYRALSRLGASMFAPGQAALFLEVGAGQAQEVLELFAYVHQDQWSGWTFHAAKDLRGVDRIVWGERVR